MQHELHNKASIFEFHSLAASWLNDTVKRKGFNDFFTLRYLKSARFGHLIFDRHTIRSCLAHLFLSKVSAPSRFFIKPFKVKQFKRSLIRDFELVVM